MKPLLDHLFKRQIFLVAWCIVAAFGTYFCMYAFRKPFTAGLYEGYTIGGGFHYKSILIIAQVIGYMISKFLGIKIISELRAGQRIRLIIGLIIVAEIALLLFGFVPFPYNWIFMLLNGLPLGMVWGVIFSFLEGRRITEFISVGLSINLVMGSGVLKTIYLTISERGFIAEFWMPATIGLLFLPIFIFFVWMLAQIPLPDATDLATRSQRKPMTKQEKRTILNEFSLSFFAVVAIYMMLTTLRDFRDNFSLEIWKELNVGFGKDVFAKTEATIGIFVLVLLITVGFVKENKKAFIYIQTLILGGVVACGLSTWHFQHGNLSAYNWMLSLGISFFLPYLLIQTLYFERFIALFKLNANAGFFVYICDSMGYLGSVGLMVYKEFFMKETSWLTILIHLSYAVSVFSILFWLLSVVFLEKKSRKPSLIFHFNKNK